MAIESKKRSIRILNKDLEKSRKGGNLPDLKCNERLVGIQKRKFMKKIQFMEQTEDTKWKDWNNKKLVTDNLNQYNKISSSRKEKRRFKAKKRKIRKKAEALEQRAKFALDNNLVINLTDEEIPAYSIAVLSYGPGWIPSPHFNELEFKVDGYNAANRQAWNALYKDNDVSPDLPSELLKSNVTSTCTTFEDPVIKQVKSSLVTFVENVNPVKPKTNMNKFELEGLNWLKSAVKSSKIAITSADKGGAIIIVTPAIIKDITAEKVSDTKRYKNVGTESPIPKLKEDLHQHWSDECEKEYVTVDQTKKAVGVLIKNDKQNTLSTKDTYKPGTPYGYPLFKVHKSTQQEIDEKKIRPSRFVTDLSNGVTARSDKFLVWKWLGPLARDYCSDLVRDSTEALCKLDSMEKSGLIKDDNYLSFSLDVVSLYDSLKHEVVLNALDDAIDTCRSDWSPEFRKWIKDMVILSFNSAVVQYDGNWYASVDGVPTGGIPSVDCGNIAVYYVLKNLIYKPEVRPIELTSFMRFVDDGTGFWQGSLDQFTEWLGVLKQSSTALYSLDFTHEVKPITEMIAFLDIQFSFTDGKLSTDLYRKPTDANRFLEYSSFHPRHTFRSIVYSQGIRYRRIINNNDVLGTCLDELMNFFIKSSYPPTMVAVVLNQLKQRPRVLEYNKNDDHNRMTPWVVTFGPGVDEARVHAQQANASLKRSQTWSRTEENNTPLIKVVTRRAPNLKDILFKRKAIALSSTVETTQGTVPCTGPNERKRGAKCQCCKLVSRNTSVTNNGRTVSASGGNCLSNNIIYAATCSLCPGNNVYVGKTVNKLRERLNGHRSNYYDLLRKREKILILSLMSMALLMMSTFWELI